MKAHCHIPSFWLIKNLVKRFEVFLIVTIVTENVVDGIKSHRHFSWNLDGSPKCSLEMIHACFLNKSKKQNWKINELISVSDSILPRNRLNVNSKIILKFDRVVTYFLEESEYTHLYLLLLAICLSPYSSLMYEALLYDI